MDTSTINARIEALRKSMKLNQADFGERIGLGGGAIGKMERGGTVTDQNIKLICEKYNVRREWLVNGEGEMYDSKENSLFSTFAKQFDLSLAEQNLAKFVLTLPTEERRQLLKNLLQMADAIRGLPPRDIDIDKEVDDYRMELEAQKAGQGKLPPSGTTAAPIQKKNA